MWTVGPKTLKNKLSIDANGLTESHGERGRALLARISLTEMGQDALARALEPWPVSLRTLDALHLATMDFLRRNDGSVELASYDNRLRRGAGLRVPACAAVTGATTRPR
jgi:hypothetical protein